MGKYPFIIRVYGIYNAAGKGILVSDEYVHGRYITKFPGGGLEFGEGTIDCLKREMMEETGHEFVVKDHFYTTDFFVPSAFDDTSQVVSVYYMMEPVGDFNHKVSSDKFNFPVIEHGAQAFRFVPISEINDEAFTLVIDQKVGKMLKERG